MKKLSFYIALLISFGYSPLTADSQFYGFWKGPHPENKNRNFFIHIENTNDSLYTKGYWTENSFYCGKFEVDDIVIKDDSIRFSIPQWQCTYKGKLVDKKKISGGFSCVDEPYDVVTLTRHNEIETFLTLSKPDIKDPFFKYSYSIPKYLEDRIQVAGYQSKNDSLFIYSLIPEIINGDYGRINSFLLFKNNRLICEEYFYGYSNQDLHQIESCTKSVTSLLVGIANDKGFITNLNEPAYKIFPDFLHLKNEPYRNITIADLLTMTSGFDPKNDQLFRSENRIDFALNRPLNNKPGTVFQYDGGNSEILGAILKVKTGLFADQFANKYLFKPLKIKSYNWEILNQEGYPSMGGSLQMRPRDMVKLGALILNNGRYNNQQIISKEWIIKSTSVKTKTHIPTDDYSYQWWNLNLKSNDKTYKAIWANGWGSQFIYVFQDIGVVIITTGHNYENDSWAITKGICKYLYLLD